MIPRKSNKANQSNCGLDTLIPTIKDDGPFQAKLPAQREKSKKQVVVARPVQAKDKNKRNM